MCFFQLAAVLATLAEWFHPHSGTGNLQDIMRRYLCPSWNISGMRSQLGEDFSNENMHAEWRFVNIVFFDLRNKSWRTEEAYNENLSKLTLIAFCELLSWSFCMTAISNAESSQRSVEEIGLMVLQKISDEINDGPYDRNVLPFPYQTSLRERLHGTGKEDCNTELPPELSQILPKLFRNDRTQCGAHKRSVQETDIGNPLSKRTKVENTKRTSQLASHHLMEHRMSWDLVPSTSSPLRPSRRTDQNHDMTANFVTDIPPPSVPALERRRRLMTLERATKHALEAIPARKSSENTDRQIGGSFHRRHWSICFRETDPCNERMPQSEDHKVPVEMNYFQSRQRNHQEHDVNIITTPSFQNLLEDVRQPDIIKVVMNRDVAEERDHLPPGLQQLTSDLEAFQSEMLRWTISPNEPESGSKEDLIHG